MALYKLLCGVTVMILLTANGCHAIMPECGQLLEGQDIDECLPWDAILFPRLCSGNLISPSFVLTDGSCGTDIQGVLLQKAQITVEVERVTCSSPSMGGLCLVKLAEFVPFTNTTNPICVASSDSVFQSGMDAYVINVDVDETTESVPIVGDTECDSFLPERPMRTVCAGRTEQQNISMAGCEESLGVGLMAKYQDYWTVIGVVNPDPKCTDIRSLRSYTAVASFADWIAEVTNMSRPGFVTFKLSGPDDFNSSTSSPSEPPHTPTSSHPNTTRPPHPPTSSHPNTTRPPHTPTSSHPNTTRPPHPPTSSHPNTTRPPHPPTSSHPNTTRPPHPPTCIHPKPPRRPTPDPSLCLYPGSNDCRNDFDSVFGNGVAIHSSPFILLCVLVLSFFGMNW